MRVAIIGAGPVGLVAALFMARRGFEVTIYEGRPDLRSVRQAGGRSFNITLSERSFHALRTLGLEEKFRSICCPLTGRMVHHQDGSLSTLPYGNNGEHIDTVSRTDFVAALLDCVGKEPGIELRFLHRLIGLNPATRAVTFDRMEGGGQPLTEVADLILLADGLHSTSRNALLRSGRPHRFRLRYSPHFYREVSLPARGAEWTLPSQYTHIWPRESAVIIATPNLSRSIVGALHMPFDGELSFSKIQTPEDVTAFFDRYFPDAGKLVPDLASQFFSRPIEPVIGVDCDPWVWEGRVALMGDAAHGVFPFMAQGVNAGLEDCEVLDRCLQKAGGDLAAGLESFAAQRKPDCDALATLTDRNFSELARQVNDPLFRLRKRLELRIGAAHPRYRSIYQIVAFSSVGYAQALAIALKQDAFFDELVAIENIEQRLDEPHNRARIEKFIDGWSPSSAGGFAR